MTGLIGFASLLAALVGAVVGMAAPVLWARRGWDRLFSVTLAAILAQFVLVTVAGLALVYALVTTDFGIKYVAMNTTRSTPIYYRVTGLWGALEGSLLLWEWILVIFAALVAWQYRARQRELLPWVLFVFSGVSVFFLSVVTFASNPFEAMSPVPLDGRGLNPLLEDANMLTHPPLLYTGFVEERARASDDERQDALRGETHGTHRRISGRRADHAQRRPRRRHARRRDVSAHAGGWRLSRRGRLQGGWPLESVAHRGTPGASPGASVERTGRPLRR